jgi:hypothetical protein
VPEAVHLASGKVREIYALDELGSARCLGSDLDVRRDPAAPIPDKGRV